MADAAIIEAVYTEWKMVKTRSALVLCFEVPLEQQAYVQGALGTPLPDQSIHVAIARLRPAAERQEASPAQVEHQPQVETERPPLRLSASAAIIGKEGAFSTFMRDVHGYFSQEPAEALRLYCGIESKRELDDEDNSAARSNFLALRSEYWSWLKCEEPA